MESSVSDEAIPARPTIYKGIRMRSRLEADYAAALDQQGKVWNYEPECFASDDGQWLPDFGVSHPGNAPNEMLTEVKPVGPLQQHIAGSVAFVNHVDTILRRMQIAWSSDPMRTLHLAFWHYGGPAYLHLFSLHQGSPWMALAGGSDLELLWIGMGQYERLMEA